MMLEKGDKLSAGELAKSDWKALVKESIRVLHQNEVEQGDIYYHMPCRNHYPSLFAWDSGFHAVAMSHINPTKAARELETLFNQLAADGHLPHEVQLLNSYSHKWTRGLQTRLVGWEYDGRGASFMIDPPSYHYAVEVVFSKTGDREWLGRLWPAMVSSLDYLLEARDILGDGLVTIFHPWESGTDLSPQFFGALKLKPGGRCSGFRAELYPTLLYAFNHHRKWDPGRLAKGDHFVCQELVMNSLTVRACLSMASLARQLGHEREERKYEARARKLMEGMDAFCWDEQGGCYFPRSGYRDPQQVRIKTAASILPIFAGLCRRDRLERIVEEQLLDPLQFWTQYPAPFNPVGQLAGAGRWVDNHLWSGHCVWTNISWMLAIGLGENGYLGQARDMTQRVARMILREGFYEYYDSRTGEGRRIRDFCWPALALDMIARFWPEIVEGEE